jgi:L-fuculose-phosphate aldolase
MEIIEAYCHTIVIAAQLGSPLKTFSDSQMQELLEIKQTLGIPDPRLGFVKTKIRK